MTSQPTAPWFLLRTISGHERLTLGALREKGLTAYVPLHIEKPDNAARRKAVRTRPLIPGYIFIALPDDESYHLAKSIHGVIGFMERADGSARRLPAYAVGVLILMEACHEWDETWEAPPPPKVKGNRYAHRWAPGDRVRITSGPFENFVGTVLKAQGKNRFDILMTVFGHSSEVSFQDKHLVKPKGEEDVASKRAA